MNKQITRELTLLQSVINAIPAPVFFKDSDGIYLGCNQAFTEFVGKTFDEIIGKGVFELWDKELAQKYYDADNALMKEGGKQSYEAHVTYADGSIHDVMFHKANFFAKSENLQGLVGVMLDITARKQSEEELIKLASTDPLTGLYNRHYLYDVLESSCKRSKRHGNGIAVLFLDLDGFKAVNDSHGHTIGDGFLTRVAELLLICVRESDTVARFGGDEFVIVLQDIERPVQYEKPAQKIIDCIQQPMVIDGKEITSGVSIGIATYPINGTNTQDLLRNADRALYKAKAKGKGQYFCC